MIGGEEHFCEVFFDDVVVPDEAVLGAVGGGWRQALQELADERSGPERFLTTIPLLLACLAEDGARPDDRELGRAFAGLKAVREASAQIAAMLGNGEDLSVPAALVKDAGTRLEQELAEIVSSVSDPARRSAHLHATLLGALVHAPGFTLRGGTSEILRSIVAKQLVGR
jgi:acyl-CoA dehydrogenase